MCFLLERDDLCVLQVYDVMRFLRVWLCIRLEKIEGTIKNKADAE